MDEDALKKRTKRFTLAAIRLCESLSKDITTSVISRQLIRAGCSVGANYRAACRGRSKADFVAKLGLVSEEVDECVYWLELLMESNKLSREKGESAIKEAEEIQSIIVASIKTARSNLRRSSKQSKI